jgi:hypothetical protein
LRTARNPPALVEEAMMVDVDAGYLANVMEEQAARLRGLATAKMRSQLMAPFRFREF